MTTKSLALALATTLIWGGTAAAAATDVLFSPPLVPRADTLDCYLVDVSDTRASQDRGLHRAGEVVENGTVTTTLGPGQEDVARATADQLPRYCKFTVQGKKGNFRASCRRATRPWARSARCRVLSAVAPSGAGANPPGFRHCRMNGPDGASSTLNLTQRNRQAGRALRIIRRRNGQALCFVATPRSRDPGNGPMTPDTLAALRSERREALRAPAKAGAIPDRHP